MFSPLKRTSFRRDLIRLAVLSSLCILGFRIIPTLIEANKIQQREAIWEAVIRNKVSPSRERNLYVSLNNKPPSSQFVARFAADGMNVFPESKNDKRSGHPIIDPKTGNWIITYRMKHPISRSLFQVTVPFDFTTSSGNCRLHRSWKGWVVDGEDNVTASDWST